jgi:type IX secretion system PorP/SprF family membrane protein
MFRKILSATVCCCVFFWAKSQSDPDLNHRWLTRLDHNPATVERSEYMVINLLGRYQWTGFKGSPASQWFDISGYMDKINSGIGLTFLHDQIGYMRTVNVKLLYSFHFPLSNKAFLALGISGGVISKGINLSAIDLENPNDPQLNLLEKGQIRPDFDFGIKFSHSLVDVGISITHLNHIGSRTDMIKLTTNNNYFYTLFHIKANNSLEICPGVSVVNRDNLFSVEVHSMFHFKGDRKKDVFWTGVTYKMNLNEATVLAGVNISQQFKIGYAYEFNFSDIRKTSYGSHELMLQYKIQVAKGPPCESYGTAIRSKRRR